MRSYGTDQPAIEAYEQNATIERDQREATAAILETWQNKTSHVGLSTCSALALAVGIMLGRVTEWSMIWPLLAFAMLAIVLAVVHARRMQTVRSLAWICLAIIALGSVWYGLQHTRLAPQNLQAMIPNDRTTVHAHGWATRDPEHRIHAVGSMARFDFRSPSTYFPMQVDTLIDQHGVAHAVQGRVLVRVGETMVPFRAGDRVALTGHIVPFQPPSNPGEFDYARYARSLGQAGMITTPDRRLVTITPAARSNILQHVLRWRDHVRQRASAWLLADLPHNTAQASGERVWLLSALLLGQRQREYIDIDDTMRRIGLAHLLAISGLHLGVLIGILLLVAQFTGGIQPRHGWIIIFAVLAYLFLIEVRLPVLRAGIMTMAGALALILARSVHIGGLLAISAIVLLLWRPDQIFSAGFQLSFGVVLALVHLSPAARIRWFGPPAADTFHVGDMSIEWLKTTTTVSIVAWCAATPIVIYHFGYFSPLAIVMSVVLLPIVSLLLTFGFVKLISAPILPTVALLAGIPLTALADVTLSLVHAVDVLPISSITLPQPSAAWSIAAVLWVIVFLRSGWRRRRLVQFWLGIILIWLLVPISWFTSSPALRIDMLNVGNGSCLVVRSAERTIVYDAGSSSHMNAGSASIVPAMRALGVRDVDTLFISHADFDHYSAVIEVVDAFRVGEVFVTHDTHNRIQHLEFGPLAYLFDALAQRRIAVRIIAAGDTLETDAGRVTWTCLHPAEAETHRHDNDSSMVLEIATAGRRVLLTGDLQTESIAKFMENYPDYMCDVMELPHHGSFIPPAVHFVQELSPAVLLQSTGWSRLHPDRWGDVLDDSVKRLITARDGAAWVEIDHDGAIRSGSFVQHE